MGTSALLALNARRAASAALALALFATPLAPALAQVADETPDTDTTVVTTPPAETPETTEAPDTADVETPSDTDADADTAPDTDVPETTGAPATTDTTTDDGSASRTTADFTVQAETITVTEGESIQDAIGSATAGDTIIVSGAHAENVNIGKAVTLKSDAEGTGSITGLITVTVDDVTIEGLNISNPNGSSAIYIVVGAATVSNVTILGNHITNVGNSSLGISTKGIFVGDSTGTGSITNLNIENNIVDGVNANPASKGAYGILINYGADGGGTTSAAIKNNTISNLDGLWAHAIGLEANTPNTEVSGNIISDLTSHKTPSDAFPIFVEANASAASVVYSGNLYEGLPLVAGTDSVIVDSGFTAADPLVTSNGSYYIVGLNAFSTVQGGIDAVAVGGIVHISAGTYVESVVVNKNVSLIGAGNDVSETIITNPTTGDSSVGVVQITGSGTETSPILLKNIRIQPNGRAGISVGRFTQSTNTNVEHVSLEGVKVIGTNTNACTEQERGLYVDNTSSLSYLSIKDSAFDNLAYGWYLQKAVSADESTVSSVSVENTTFNHNGLKGIYAEKLSSAAFDGIVVDGNGFSSESDLQNCSYFGPNMAGVDINLKAGNYENIAFNDATITNNAADAANGVGIAIKARDDGSYTGFPATLDGVEITGGTVSGNKTGIRFGEPTKNNAGPVNAQVHNVTITGNLSLGIDNQAVANINAARNWFGSADESMVQGSVSANVMYAPWYVDAEKTTLAASVAPAPAPVSTDGITVTVTLAAGTVVTSDDASWDGMVSAPTAKPVADLNTIEISGFKNVVPVAAIEVGVSGKKLILSQAARLSFAGQAGKLVGWTVDGDDFTPITTACTADDQTAGDALAAGADCVMNVGSDLVVWTKHFTTFVAYTADEIPASTGTSGGGGSSSGSRPGSQSIVTAPVGQVLGAAVYNFTADLTIGSRGADVTALQQILIDAGLLKIDAPTGYFGTLTQAALAAWQAAHGVAPAAGYFGPITRAALAAASTPAPQLDAATIETIKAKIADLLAQVAEIQAKLAAL